MEDLPPGLIFVGIVAANDDFLITNVLVWNLFVHPTSLDFLKLVTIERVRQTDIIAENEGIFSKLRLSQHCVKPFAPFGGEALNLVLLLLLPRHLENPYRVVDKKGSQPRHLLADGLLPVQLVDGIPPSGVELQQLYRGEVAAG